MNSSIQAKIDQFFSQFPTRKYEKGQNMIFAGDDPQYIFYLVEGNVRQYDISHRGDEIVVNVFKPHAFFPMSWAINKTPNDFFFAAASDVTVRLAKPKTVIDFVKQNPDILFDLLSRVYRGTDGLLGRLVRLMSASAANRLTFELLVECRRFGKHKKDDSCVIEINETELAARAGLSRETISREIQKLAKDYLVEVSHGQVIIKNVSDLEQKLGETI
jgi:CRP/FNR family cyclic AMP-dependent transcriptional regulator